MIRCPECNNLLKSYCSKLKRGERIRYYKCEICGKTLKTKVEIKVTEEVINEDYDK
ncbi:hypothetical protein [uncultured Fusobacterium sp.]|jgi:transcription elongation factor Elf1|uniref:hypothetical protein n=1 Tax=uncultured Fusobacterium sp. TaxID=159267 RepID=UPI0025D02270|nr:hypothetical protein [uncultured Fusobacterium sp.]